MKYEYTYSLKNVIITGVDPGILDGGPPPANAKGAEKMKRFLGAEGAQNMKIRVPNKRFPGIWDQNPRPYNSELKICF